MPDRATTEEERSLEVRGTDARSFVSEPDDEAALLYDQNEFRTSNLRMSSDSSTILNSDPTAVSPTPSNSWPPLGPPEPMTALST